VRCEKNRTVAIIIIFAFFEIYSQVSAAALSGINLPDVYTGKTSQQQQVNSTLNLQTTQNIATDEIQSDIFYYQSAESYIDENNYYLGSGDVLKAVIWAVSETALNISVSGETCIIPTVGALDIGSIPLKDAKEKIAQLIKKKYKADRVDIFLSNVKNVNIQVQGQVAIPGNHTAAGNMSVSAFIEYIGGTSLDANLREIKLIHPKYGTRVVDILKSNRIIGYSEEVMRNGDRLFVPRRDLLISINGAVQYGGNYDFVDGDKLSDIINISGGILASADSSRIIVTRFVGEKDTTVKITVNLKDADSFALEKDDMITINRKSEYRPIRQVEIFGEVCFPGIYSIIENQTRLIEIIKLAGGLTDNAFLGASKIIRQNFIDAGENERQKLLSANGKVLISPSESNYLKYRTDARTKVSIDFANLPDENTLKNILLHEGDKIIIEKKSGTVNVMGAVVRPGLVQFDENKKFDYYVEQAGGYKSDAIKKNVRVIKAGTEVWLRPSQVNNIEHGDAIWVPEKDYVSKMETQQSVSIASGVLSVIGSIATVVTAAITVISFVQKE
jgi:protein involved in polysaccharide export with SLBB domain